MVHKADHTQNTSRDKERAIHRGLPPWSCMEAKREDTSTEGNVGIIDLTWDDEVEHPHKRKRTDDTGGELEGEPEGTEGAQDKLVKLLKTVDLEARRLAKLVALCPSTKREIRESAAAIRYMTAQLATKEMAALARGEKTGDKKEEAMETSDATPKEGTAKQRQARQEFLGTTLHRRKGACNQ